VLEKFLESKPLYYDVIDHTRMPKAYGSIKHKIIIPKIIHIVGTNGKGTTGRFIATALQNNGYKVSHYTSPHILNFNERIWIDGADIDKERLNDAHLELKNILSDKFIETLSYFEYTTLLALFVSQDVDYLILEAGLGGEYDATSVFKNILTVVTPIDIDHEMFLGNSIKDIATTKLNAIQKQAIISKQKHQDVYKVALELSQKKGLDIFKTSDLIDEDDKTKLIKIAQEQNLAPYLKENLSTAIAVLNHLGIAYKVSDFQNSRLFGRVTQLKKNIILDVGHNLLAAQSIKDSLKENKYTLVYNSFKDKDYTQILKVLKPIIKDVELIEINDTRAEDISKIEFVLDSLDIQHKKFKDIQDDKEYLVFGSFSVAEAFLRFIDG